MKVVKELVCPFVGLNRVIYFDNFYSNGPLFDLLAKDSIFFSQVPSKSGLGAFS